MTKKIPGNEVDNASPFALSFTCISFLFRVHLVSFADIQKRAAKETSVHF